MVARPLIFLTHKYSEFVWGPEQVENFTNLKEALVNEPLLAYPDYDLPMEIYTDACGYGLGAVLSQTIEGKGLPLPRK